MAANVSVDCATELDMGFNLLFVSCPLYITIMCKSILLIWTVNRTSSLHTNTNILVASMSVADLFLGAAYLCVGLIDNSILSFSKGQKIPITNFVFGVWHSTICICCVHIAIIAIDRYVLIGHPFHYMKYMTRRCPCVALFCVWTVGLFFLFLPMLIYTDSKYHRKCLLLHPPIMFYSLGTSIYLASCVTVLICYSRIAILAFNHKMASMERKLQRSASDSDGIFSSNLTAALKSVKFCVLMFGVFLLCTLPPTAGSGMTTFLAIPAYLYIGFKLLFPVNAILGFVIYFKMNKNFSKAAKKLISDLCVRCCQRHGKMK